MPLQFYNIIANDWINLEFIINDLTQRVVGQVVSPASSPEFNSLTLTGDLDLTGGVVIGGSLTLSTLSADSLLATDSSSDVETVTIGAGLVYTSSTLGVDGVLEDLDTLGPNSANGEFIVGSAAGTLVWESGDTARTSLGLGTGDSPVFTNIDVTGLIDGRIAYVGSGALADSILEADSTTVSVRSSGAKSDGLTYEQVSAIQTTDATVTTLDSLTLEDENTYNISAQIVGVKSDGTDRASYNFIGTYYRTGAGNATIQGSVTTTHTEESNSSWSCVLDTNSNDVRVRVTGVAATTIEWSCSISYLNVSS